MNIQTMLTLIVAGFLLNACSKSTRDEIKTSPVNMPIPETVEKKPYTSTHIFKARLKNVTYQLCTAYTSRCPVSCGASGDYANFEVLEYKTHLVNGAAGKDPLTRFTVLLSDYYKKDYDRNDVKFTRSLHEGAVVTIYVDYVYDTSKSSVATVVNILGMEESGQ